MPAPITLAELDAAAKAIGESLLTDDLDRALAACVGTARQAKAWTFTTWDGGPDASYARPRPPLEKREAHAVAMELKRRVRLIEDAAAQLARVADQIADAAAQMEDARIEAAGTGSP